VEAAKKKERKKESGADKKGERLVWENHGKSDVADRISRAVGPKGDGEGAGEKKGMEKEKSRNGVNDRIVRGKGKASGEIPEKRGRIVSSKGELGHSGRKTQAP